MSASGGTSGRRDVVLTLHSSGLSSRQWGRRLRAIEPEFEVIHVDFLGYGESATVPAEERFDFRRDVAHAETFVPEGARVHLVGHSYGGLCALQLALRLGDRVASIAVYEPVAFGVLYDADDRDGIADLARVDADGTFMDDATGGDDAWLRGFVDYWNAPGAWDAMQPVARAAFARVGRKAFQEVRSLMEDRTPRAAYAAIAAPTLVMRGERSPVAARHTAAILAEAIPRATLTTVAGVGHMGPLTHADAVSDAIVAHVGDARRASVAG
jgi:pimeloyl-ACP methyl ester carboxylesterase